MRICSRRRRHGDWGWGEKGGTRVKGNFRSHRGVVAVLVEGTSHGRRSGVRDGQKGSSRGRGRDGDGHAEAGVAVGE